MVTRPLVLVIICFGFFILLHALVPKVMAQQRSTNLNQFMSQDQRIRKRKDYIFQLARDSKIVRNNDNELYEQLYETEALPSDLNPEELSTFMAKYANMLRNDIILLDDSVPTKTRKRADIKIKRQNQAIPDPPCNCESTSDHLDLGENSYPRYVETRNCSRDRQSSCLPPYICKENMYELTIMKRRESQRQGSVEVPFDLKRKWIAEKRPVSVGCICARDYIVET